MNTRGRFFYAVAVVVIHQFYTDKGIVPVCRGCRRDILPIIAVRIEACRDAVDHRRPVVEYDPYAELPVSLDTALRFTWRGDFLRCTGLGIVSNTQNRPLCTPSCMLLLFLCGR